MDEPQKVCAIELPLDQDLVCCTEEQLAAAEEVIKQRAQRVRQRLSRHAVVLPPAPPFGAPESELHS